ncbi:hypothetical protein OG21DRAFT_1164766 [Imleria badia]|nr:hypothetical protein OG21DRAFT_1164766 [Imleria badia]
MLSEDVVNRRIALISPYDVGLDPGIRDVTTSRTFTSKQWGGNTVHVSQHSARHAGTSRLERFHVSQPFFNPHAPQWPGPPGLFFDPGVDWKRTAWNSTRAGQAKVKLFAIRRAGSMHASTFALNRGMEISSTWSPSHGHL